jgi:hypothetical protein
MTDVMGTPFRLKRRSAFRSTPPVRKAHGAPKL